MLGLVSLFSLAVSVGQALHVGPFMDSRWTELAIDEAPVNLSEVISLTLALQIPHADRLHHHLMQISDPTSPHYRRYLHDPREIVALSGVQPSHVQVVVEWLIASGIAKDQIRVGRTLDMIRVKAPIARWEQALGAHFRWFQPLDDTTGAQVHRRRLRVSKALDGVPPPVARHLAFISANTPVHFHSRLSGKSLRISEDSMEAEGKRGFEVYEAQDTAALVFDVDEGALEGLEGLKVTLHDSDYPSQELTLSRRQLTCRAKKYRNGKKAKDGEKVSTCRAVLARLPKYITFEAEVVGVYSSSEGSSSSSSSSKSLSLRSPPFTLTDVATPDLLNQLYDIPDGIQIRHGSTQAVAEFYGEFWSPKDLDAFCDLVGIPRQSIAKENVRGDNPNDPNHPGGEAQLDVEYLLGIARAPPNSTWFYSIKERNPFSHANEGFLTWLEYLSEDENPPLVHSLSYGDEEPEIFNASIPGATDYARRIDLEFLIFGLRGLTILTASGDDGASAPYCHKAWPSWPSTSPYITVVGATQLTTKYLPAFDSIRYASGLPIVSTRTMETTCSSSIGGVITTGGGFSNIYGRDDLAPWQSQAVEAYLKTPGATPSSSWFNNTGRAYPDISAYGSNYLIHLEGQVMRESGTSASTPVVAAMMTLWNDALLGHGLPPLGFVNPTLYHLAYHHPEAFNDITTGSNGCAAGHGDVMCCPKSFNAAPGWDATTGIGTPRWKVITDLLLSDEYTTHRPRDLPLLGSSLSNPHATTIPSLLWAFIMSSGTLLVSAVYLYSRRRRHVAIPGACGSDGVHTDEEDVEDQRRLLGVRGRRSSPSINGSGTITYESIQDPTRGRGGTGTTGLLS